MQQGVHPKIWQLYCVPQFPMGRLALGCLLFAILVAVFWLTGALGPNADPGNWPAALFFCVIIAYIIPVFHYISARTQRSLDELAPKLAKDAEELARLRSAIERKPPRWQLLNSLSGVAMWLLQNWLLFRNEGLYELVSQPAQLSIILGSLPVWLLANQAVHALIDNAVLFRRLAQQVDVELLHTRELHPFGDMAISSTLMIIGAMASMSLLWLDGQTNPWTTIPGLSGMTIALFVLFCLPIWPIHKAIASAKRSELQSVQRRLREQTTAVPENLAPLLTYRREVEMISEWPFDTTSIARFSIYLFIVPMTWVGAALIEILVDGFIAS